MVWTGSEVLDVGGDFHGEVFGIGGSAFNPALNRWRILPFLPLPASDMSEVRAGVWTGSELVVVVVPNVGSDSGGRTAAVALRPEARQWSRLPSPPTSVTDPNPGIVWTGREVALISSGDLAEGSVEALFFEPGERRWRTVPAPRIPSGYVAYPAGHDIVVIGHDIVVVGGLDRTTAWLLVGSGRRWHRLAPPPATPMGFAGASAWTGHKLVVVQRACNGRSPLLTTYDRSSNRWSLRPIDPSPLSCHQGRLTAWTGHEMLVTGETSSLVQLGPAGAALDPASGHWRPMPIGPPLGDYFDSAVWDGTEMLVIGGSNVRSTQYGPGAAYRPPRPVPRPAAPAQPLTASAYPACPPAQLQARYSGLTPRSRTYGYAVIHLSTNGPGPCRVQGAPRLALLDRQGRPLPVPITTDDNGSNDAEATPGAPLVLRPNTPFTADITLLVDLVDPQRAPCQTPTPRPAGGATITLPDTGQVAITVTDEVPSGSPDQGLARRSVRDLQACGTITVSPIQPSDTSG